MSAEYNDYLQTDYWKAVAVEVKKRAGYRCQVCNSQLDLCAHHRTYDHRGKELEHLDDLICLCRRCHETFHGKQQAQELPRYAGIAKSKEIRGDVEMVLITEQNRKRLRCKKVQWHWMYDNGINPKKAGWSKRAIGFEVPANWLRY